MSGLYRLWHWWLGLSGKDRATIILELIGILVVAAYTKVAAMQWLQMRDATEASKESADAAVAATRAWLVFDSFQLVPIGATFKIVLVLENAGKTPLIYGFTGNVPKIGTPGPRPPDFPDCVTAD